MIAPDPFKTEKPITERGKTAYATIAARLAALHPPIFIERHIAQDTRNGKTQFSTLEAENSTLDGISFTADDPGLLAKALNRATDKWDEPALISMKEDPAHWPLKASLGATIGTGWREVWREIPFSYIPTPPQEHGGADSVLKMRFGTAGKSIRFTALHCAVQETDVQARNFGLCNIHIDDAGFMLSLPTGITLTADFYGHLVNELLWKTTFRDWLSGEMPNDTARDIVREVIRRVSFDFINSSNGYAGLDKDIHRINRIRTPSDAIFTVGRIILPVGITVDVIDRESYKVQVTGSRADGNLSATLTIGGEW